MKTKAKHRSKTRPTTPAPSPGEILAALDRAKRKRERAFSVTFALIASVVFLERVIAHRSQRELPSAVSSGRSCESLLARVSFLFPEKVNQETECYLRFARERYVAHPGQLNEETMIQLASLFSAEKRMSADTMMKLIELWIITHPRVKSESDLDRLRGDFDVAEGLISVMEFFEAKPLDLGRRRGNIESQRKLKLFELLKLTEWYQGMRARMNELEQESRRVKSSSEMSLLEIRIKKMNQRMKAMPYRWKMSEAIDSLHADETFPDQVKKIRSMIPVEK